MPFQPIHPIKSDPSLNDEFTSDAIAYHQAIHNIAEMYNQAGKSAPAGMVALSEALIVSAKSKDKSDLKDEIKGSQSILNDLQAEAKNGGPTWIEGQDKASKISLFKSRVDIAVSLLKEVMKITKVH